MCLRIAEKMSRFATFAAEKDGNLRSPHLKNESFFAAGIQWNV